MIPRQVVYSHVHNPDSGKITSFHQLPSGLYVQNIKAPSPAMAFVETVDENKKVFSARQFIRAKAARELYGTLGVPSTQDYIGAVTVEPRRIRGARGIGQGAR